VASGSGPHPEEIAMFPFACRSVLIVPCSPPDTWGAAPIDPVPQPARRSHIGVVAFSTHKGERAEAILDADGKWLCPTLPVLERPLDTLYGPRRDSGPDMPFGHAELMRTAAWLKGVAKVRRP
jgi:hypothetical protein